MVMYCRQAVEQVLRDSGQPLHYRVITEKILESNLWESKGKTPDQTVYATLSNDINEKGDKSLFIKVAPGIFSLRENELQQILPDEASVKPFNPSNFKDAREWISQTIAYRRGQGDFRKELLEAYGGRCAITGCTVVDTLEAAHIYPYRGSETNSVTNGLLLRADVHTLFDLGWITIDPGNMTVLVHEELTSSEYRTFHGKKLHIPSNLEQKPSEDALKFHYSVSRFNSVNSTG